MPRNTGSNDLYLLIHSLTTEEKGYFKKFASRHSNRQSKHLQLFDAISKQTEFEEAGLKKKFTGYADMKVYLFDMILKSLFLLESNNQSHAVTMLMGYAGILNKKGMIGTAKKLLLQALELARKDDFFDRQLLILSGLNMIQLRDVPIHKKWDFITERFKEESAIIEQRTYVSAMLHEHAKLVFLHDAKAAGNAYAHLIKHINQKFIEGPAPGVSQRTARIRSEVLGMYYDLIDRHLKARQVFYSNMKDLEKTYNRLKTETSLMQYARSIIKYVATCLSSGHTSGVKALLIKLSKIDTGVAFLNSNFQFQCVNLMQQLALLEKKYEQGIALTTALITKPGFAGLLSRFVPTGISVYQNLALLQWHAKKYPAVYLTLQEIYGLNKNVKSKKLVADNLVLNMMVQIEMNNYELLPSLIASAKRIALQKNSNKEFIAVVRLLSGFSKQSPHFKQTTATVNTNYSIYGKLSFDEWQRQFARRKSDS